MQDAMILKSYLVLPAQERAVFDYSFKSPHKSNTDQNSFGLALVSITFSEIDQKPHDSLEGK
ncbi:hypothetical protein BH18THE2_BH18THE2_19260 [soil metagenome]